MNYNPEDLPFRIDKTSKATFTDQLVDGVRKAVADGVLKEGDRLPSREAMARHFGVSLRVPRMAYWRLKAEGVVITRTRLGCVIARPTGLKKWKSVVLYVRHEADSDSFSGSTIEFEVRRKIEASGYLMLTVGIRLNAARSFDFSAVERCFEFNVALAIVCCTHPAIRRWFSRSNLPYVIFGGVRGVDGCVGNVLERDDRSAQEDFVAQCVERGILRVLQVGILYPGALNLKPLLEESGIVCDIWKIPPLHGLSHLDGIVQASTRAFLRRFEKEGKSWLPDLLLFTDDYVASGALAAFAAYGIRAPNDIRFATLVNEGNRIPYAKKLSAFVHDPKKLALRLISPALAYLNRREVPVNNSQYMTYERGETFP